MYTKVRLTLIGVMSIVMLMAIACKPSKPTPTPEATLTPPLALKPTPTPEPEATLTPTPALKPTPTPAEVPVYPGAEVLDISSVDWNEIAPWPLVGDPEEFLQHWAWRTKDLAQKVTVGYDEIMYNANWETETYWEPEDRWHYARYRRGDDESSLGIIGNLSSVEIGRLPDIGLKPGDTLIVMAIGNPQEARLAHGRDLLEAGDLDGALSYARQVIRIRIAEGVGWDDRYVQDAAALIDEAMRRMTPVDAASDWFRNNVTVDVFTPDKAEDLDLMRRLGLVREYEGGLIDSYYPAGDWREVSNEGTTAVVEFVGVAEAKMSNRLIPSPEVPSFDYALRVWLRRNEESIWEVDEQSFIVGSSLEELQERTPEEMLLDKAAPYKKGIEHFDEGRYWDAAYWLGKLSEMSPHYKDVDAKLESARRQIGRIAFATQIGDERERLWIMTADGSDQEVLVPEADLRGSNYVQISLKGDRLLLHYWLDGKLYASVLDVGNGRTYPIMKGVDNGWEFFTPDGTGVVFGYEQDTTRWSIYISDITGTNQRELFSDVEWAWGNSDGAIFIQVLEDRKWILCAFDSKGNNRRVIASDKDWVFAQSVPNQQQIMIGIQEGDTWRLVIADLNGNPKAEVLSGTDRLFWAQFSKDGRKILVETDSDEGQGLTIVDAVSQETVQLVMDSSLRNVWGELSPDGEGIWFQTIRDADLMTTVYVASADGTQRHELLSGCDSWLTGASFSPDGKKLAYGCAGTGIFVANADGSEPLMISEDGYNPQWFGPEPDEQSFIVGSSPDELQVVEIPRVVEVTPVPTRVEGRLGLLRERGYLICGCNAELPGFGYLNPEGEFEGFDIDFCKAIAAAVLGDANKVEYRPLTAAERLPALQTGEIDVLIRNTTWTLTRDTANEVDWAAVTFYDGQGMMVPVARGWKTLEDMDGATVCSTTGTTTEMNLANAFRSRGLDYTPLLFEKTQDTATAYEEGRCDGLTSDKSHLAALRSAMAHPEDHVILDVTMSKEPLGPLTAHGDDQWNDVVRWVVWGMMQAEESGVGSQNVDQMLSSDDPTIKRLLGVEGELGTSLGIDNDFMVKVLKQVGNYEEVYNRNLGPGTVFNLNRGLNALWTEGGLIYAPPFR